MAIQRTQIVYKSVFAVNNQIMKYFKKTPIVPWLEGGCDDFPGLTPAETAATS